MTLRGHVKNGVVVLDESGDLPEGVEVLIEVPAGVGNKRKPARKPKAKKTVGERLMKFAGKLKGLPVDLARNHDHYVHGVPKE